MFLTAFFALLRVGELIFPDDQKIRDWQKIARRSTVVLHNDRYEFTLPSHKADQTFEGSTIMDAATIFLVLAASTSLTTWHLAIRFTLWPRPSG
jgi:hypothetical protein